MSAAVLHDRLATTAALYAFVMGVWALAYGVRRRDLDGNYLGAILIGEGLLMVEAGLGAWLMLGTGMSPARGIHLLYGILAVLIWPFLFTVTSGDKGESAPGAQAILFGLGTIFLWGLLLRAATTGAVG